MTFFTEAKLVKKAECETHSAAKYAETLNLSVTQPFCQCAVQATPSVSAVTHEHPSKNITFTFY